MENLENLETKVPTKNLVNEVKAKFAKKTANAVDTGKECPMCGRWYRDEHCDTCGY